MTTKTHILIGAALLAAAACTTIPLQTPASSPTPPAPPSAAGDDGVALEFTGNAGRRPDSKKPHVTAYFERESYAPGESARLVVTDRAAGVVVRLHRAGTETTQTIANDVMLGAPVGPRIAVGAVAGRKTVTIRIGDYPSGVYFAQLDASGSRTGYAPFVLRPRRLGEHRIAVVMPTETWQAYNFRDDNGDGRGDTWYAGWRESTARLQRAFLNRGVPPHWKQYDAPFVRWLVQTKRDVDYLSDAELRTAQSGDVLAKAYELIVFSGHHEYVTTHEYDVVVRYRDLGGNLAFLAANNFFWKITIANHVMTRVEQWRHLGRPEAALIGVQYRANDRGTHRGPWLVRGAASSVPWLFAGVELPDGNRLGSGGIEIDSTSAASPRSVRVVAEIPNLYGPGFTGQMTYYETAAGARVFAAGAFTLAGSVWDPDVATVVTNVWEHLSID